MAKVLWKVYPIGVNRLGKLLSYTLAFVLCYSQLVASAHFVEHLPQHSHSKAERNAAHAAEHNAKHSAEHKNHHLAQHTSSHVNHLDLNSHNSALSASGSPEQGERSTADCTIYHFYSALNGLVQARTDIPCSSFDHVITVATHATPHQQAFANYQPIRAPPLFS